MSDWRKRLNDLVGQEHAASMAEVQQKSEEQRRLKENLTKVDRAIETAVLPAIREFQAELKRMDRRLEYERPYQSGNERIVSVTMYHTDGGSHEILFGFTVSSEEAAPFIRLPTPGSSGYGGRAVYETVEQMTKEETIDHLIREYERMMKGAE